MSAGGETGILVFTCCKPQPSNWRLDQQGQRRSVALFPTVGYNTNGSNHRLGIWWGKDKGVPSSSLASDCPDFSATCVTQRNNDPPSAASVGSNAGSRLDVAGIVVVSSVCAGYQWEQRCRHHDTRGSPQNGRPGRPATPPRPTTDAVPPLELRAVDTLSTTARPTISLSFALAGSSAKQPVPALRRFRGAGTGWLATVCYTPYL